MGYPVRAYRTGEARAASNAARVLRGFQDALSNRRPRRTMGRLPSAPNAPNNVIRIGKITKAPPVLSYRWRLLLRQRALGGVSKGLKIRAMLFRWLAKKLLDEAFTPWVERNLRPHPMPGWNLIAGSWGNPYYSGLTNAHTTGTTVSHTAVPGSGPGGDNWDGVPFDWAEYESITQINPNRWDFFQIGRGDRGSGPDPRTISRWNNPQRNQNEAPGLNPYKPNFEVNTEHPGLPGRVKKPKYRRVWEPIDEPSLDPMSRPINRPARRPRSIPYRMLPGRKPNPYRAPGEQHQWGPNWQRWWKPTEGDDNPFPDWDLPEPRPAPKPKTGVGGIDPFPIIDRAPKPKPDKDPKSPPVPKTETRVWERTELTPRAKLRSREKREDRPPGPKTKERKSAAASAKAARLLRWVNRATEFSDFLRALFKALPDKYKKKSNGQWIKTPSEQWKAVYDHFTELNLEHAIRSVLRDQIEDMIYGTTGRISGKAAHRRGQIYDQISRINSQLRKIDDGSSFDPVDYVLDNIFGADT